MKRAVIHTIDKNSPIVEHAAAELSGYLTELFDCTCHHSTAAKVTREGFERLYVVGSIQENPLPDQLPANVTSLSTEGHAVVSDCDGVTWLIGGSPKAALWSVYSFVEQCGVVYTLQGDVLPKNPALPPAPWSTVWEPRQEQRIWRVMDELFTGAISWSTDQATSLIRQLVKQKYNGILLDVWCHTPFVDFTIDGVSRTTWSVGFGDKIKLGPDNIGAAHFGDGNQFLGRVFDPDAPFDEALTTGVGHLREMIKTAKDHDMHVVLGIQPFDFATDYAPLMEKPVEVLQAGTQSITEGGDITGPHFARLLRAHFDAYRTTYPQVDEFLIAIPEHPRGTEQFPEAWDALDQKFGLSSKYDVEKLLNDRPSTMLAAGGHKRSEREGRMTIVMIHTLHQLLDTTGIGAELAEDGTTLSLAAGLSCPALVPLIADSLWDDAVLALAPGYTASRSVRSLRYAAGRQSGRTHIRQVLTLQDDNVGSLPQVATRSVRRLIEFGVENSWVGYTTRFWPIGDLDPVSSYLSKAGWEYTDVDDAYQHHFGALYGEDSASPLTQAWHLLEDATVLLDLHHLGFLFPLKNHFSRKIEAGRTLIDESLWHIRALYREAISLIDAVLNRMRLRDDISYNHLAYHRSRLQFGIDVIDGHVEVECGNMAVANGELSAAESAYYRGIAKLREALEVTAANVRDDSDLGTLALYFDAFVREGMKKINAVLNAASDTGTRRGGERSE